jgi:flagellar hook protein FlgE
MNLSLFSGATGMEAQQMNLNVISNNIANVNTTGFKKAILNFKTYFITPQDPLVARLEQATFYPLELSLETG